MKLILGQTAPDFTIQDIHGNDLKLSDFKGRKIILTFMRNVSCPFCNVRVHKLMGNSVYLQRSGAQMILFFESTAQKLKSSVLHQGVSPWPMVGDPERTVYTQYGVEKSVVKMLRTFVSVNSKEIMKTANTLDYPKARDTDASASAIPADFFIDEKFNIVNAYYGKHLDDHVDMEVLKRFADI